MRYVIEGNEYFEVYFEVVIEFCNVSHEKAKIILLPIELSYSLLVLHSTLLNIQSIRAEKNYLGTYTEPGEGVLSLEASTREV